MAEGTTDAVILTDIQADFMELNNGALAVPGTGKDYLDEVIAVAGRFKEAGLPIVATQDYHPADHMSFCTGYPGRKPFDVVGEGDDQRVLWPPHCVQATPGAEILVPGELINEIVHKGTRRAYDSYSGFRDDGGTETGLKEVLRRLGARRLIIFGLATDYCVKATALHALQEGFQVTVLLGLSRGITAEGTAAAVEEMRKAGAEIQE